MYVPSLTRHLRPRTSLLTDTQYTITTTLEETFTTEIPYTSFSESVYVSEVTRTFTGQSQYPSGVGPPTGSLFSVSQPSGFSQSVPSTFTAPFDGQQTGTSAQAVSTGQVLAKGQAKRIGLGRGRHRFAHNNIA